MAHCFWYIAKMRMNKARTAAKGAFGAEAPVDTAPYVQASALGLDSGDGTWPVDSPLVANQLKNFQCSPPKRLEFLDATKSACGLAG